MIAFAWQAALAFNLICNVSIVADDGVRMNAVEVYRVDLEARRYCFDECRSTLPIAAVSETEITLQNDPPGSPEGEMVTVISRESGAYRSRASQPLVTRPPPNEAIEIITSGQCQPAPFTGFPRRRF